MECPFLVQKLKIKILPTLDIFIRGVRVDRYLPCMKLYITFYLHLCVRMVGFDDLDRTDTFSTATLSRRIAMSGIFALIKEPASDEDVDPDH
jgi:hypothetical protein